MKKPYHCDRCAHLFDFMDMEHFEITDKTDHTHVLCSEECVQKWIDENGMHVVTHGEDTHTLWETSNNVAWHNKQNAKAGGWSGD
ncbi:MAG: hypothetical protein V3V10_06785 [Planctomycetota bacterium]